MSDNNKVRFGLSNVHFGTYEVAANGTVTLGTPYAQKGAVNLTLDPESEENVFYADNQRYYVDTQDNGFSGELETAKFDDEFKTQFMNYAAMTGGGVGQFKNRSNKKVYMIFEVAGDVQARRTILYNVTLGQISTEQGTTEDATEPSTETLPITVIGDNATGLVSASYEQSDTPYATLFTEPPVPTAAPSTGA